MEEIDEIQILIILAVSEYNTFLPEAYKKRRCYIIDLSKNYKQQYIPLINAKGEKEVWVNCFCITLENNRWKHSIIEMEDGGSSLFNFKVNLTTKQYF